MNYLKYHALGNDYLVLDPKDASELPAEEAIVRICHRNFGLGSDGILSMARSKQTKLTSVCAS